MKKFWTNKKSGYYRKDDEDSDTRYELEYCDGGNGECTWMLTTSKISAQSFTAPECEDFVSSKAEGVAVIKRLYESLRS
jgi:hypothetical protein